MEGQIVYSNEVRREQARADRNEALGFVFLIWRRSVPAKNRGLIDRV